MDFWLAWLLLAIYRKNPNRKTPLTDQRDAKEDSLVKPAKQSQHKSNAAKPETAPKLTRSGPKQSVRAKYSIYVFQGPDPFLMILANL